ncbi:MAG: fructose-1,6-bisphosphatase [Sporomusaceae bacterium]|nr:fructose-1,6-bisphosphatase [Sporomusaceae bacterium]
MTDLRYLRLLAEQYPSIQAASNAIIRLTALLQLPKGTEHFLSDIHGEHEAFSHVIKNGAGSIWRKLEEMFGRELSRQELRNLATLIYYPEQKLPLLLKATPQPAEWSRQTLFRLIRLCRLLTAKYRLETVRKYLPEQSAAIIEELLYEQETIESKQQYYNSLIDTIVATASAPSFIIALAELIQRLAIARLHVLGDIYDRGPGPHLILDALMEYHHVDLQWGNHDIIWMGAAAGSEACMANVIRICLRYGNMESLENGYGISLLPLASFALETYTADPCDRFMPKVLNKGDFTNPELRLMAQMHKAMTIIQFKLEGQMIKRRRHYQMEARLLLDKIDYRRGTIRLDETEYPLLDSYFPTIDPADVYRLTDAEQLVVDKLKLSFTHSKKLQQHVRFLFSKGGIYHIYNGNLLYHGCIAMNADGSFKAFSVDGRQFAGKAFLDRVDRLARQGYFADDNPEQKQYGMDLMWFLWCAPQSPLFGKEKMTTFERYFIADPETHIEPRNPYYDLRDSEETACKILAEFGLDPARGHIINGHVPVKVKKGEAPVKANGRMIVIDGGFAKAYQRETGIAGYTLISNSIGLLLAAHRPFASMQKAIAEEMDIDSETEIIETHPVRMRVGDTDDGKQIQCQIDDLKQLLAAYREGLIKEP